MGDKSSYVERLAERLVELEDGNAELRGRLEKANRKCEKQENSLRERLCRSMDQKDSNAELRRSRNGAVNALIVSKDKCGRLKKAAEDVSTALDDKNMSLIRVRETSWKTMALLEGEEEKCKKLEKTIAGQKDHIRRLEERLQLAKGDVI